MSDDTTKLQEIEGEIEDLFEDLYQYGSERRHEQRREVFPRGGKKTRRRRSTKNAAKQKYHTKQNGFEIDGSIPCKQISNRIW